MSKQANPTLIGGFVVAAAILAIATVLILSGGRLWAQTQRFVVVFEGSVHGLSIGAPVTFRGVPVGQVTDISPVVLIQDGKPAGLDVLVTLELQRRGQLRTATGETANLAQISDVQLADFFDRSGVRAQLALQSILTGQLYVDLDFYPGSPLKKAAVEAPYPQLATIETGLKKLGKAIETLPIDQLTGKALSVLEGIDRKINSPEMDRILVSAAVAATALEKILRRVEADVDPLARSVREASEATAAAMRQAEQTLAFESGVPGKMATSLVATLDQVRETLTRVQGPAGQLVANLSRAAESADQALREMRKAMSEASEMLDDRSATRRGMQHLLDESAAAARSLRQLADYLERHPEALVQGKSHTR
jgi:paraquat-inducible protein B